MEIILDADVVIRGEKGSFNVSEWLASRADDTFSVAAITIAELWHGVERADTARRSPRERYLRALVGALDVLPYTEQTAYAHARLWAELQRAGKMIGYYDVIVAATALEWDRPVATFNRRHFECVRGLQIVEPAIMSG
jgi:predicted nucleic acid-binding protein